MGDFCRYAGLGAVRGAGCVRRRYQRQVVVVVVVGERRACNAGLRSGLLGCSALLWRWAALSLKLLASTCSSTCILHSIASFKYGVKYNCAYKHADLMVRCMVSYTTDLVTSHLPSINGKHAPTPAGFDCTNPSGIIFAASNACFCNIKRRNPSTFAHDSPLKHLRSHLRFGLRLLLGFGFELRLFLLFLQLLLVLALE